MKCRLSFFGAALVASTLLLGSEISHAGGGGRPRGTPDVEPTINVTNQINWSIVGPPGAQVRRTGRNKVILDYPIAWTPAQAVTGAP